MDTRITPPTRPSNISSIGFHRYASEFAKYARDAHAAAAVGEFSPVPYYLYCHSLELVLKAFLLEKGVSIRDLPKRKKFGHDLSKILLKAKTLGLEQTVPLAAHWESEVQTANAYYNDKGFEYFDIRAAGSGTLTYRRLMFQTRS
jgi:hypothetical protein